jgi:hypothetical protein
MNTFLILFHPRLLFSVSMNRHLSVLSSYFKNSVGISGFTNLSYRSSTFILSKVTRFFYLYLGKDEAIRVTGCEGPLGGETSRLLHFL